VSKHADEPLCKHCGEDRLDMVTATRDGRLIVWHCSVCGQSWRQSDSSPTSSPARWWSRGTSGRA